MSDCLNDGASRVAQFCVRKHSRGKALGISGSEHCLHILCPVFDLCSRKMAKHRPEFQAHAYKSECVCVACFPSPSKHVCRQHWRSSRRPVGEVDMVGKVYPNQRLIEGPSILPPQQLVSWSREQNEGQPRKLKGRPRVML